MNIRTTLAFSRFGGGLAKRALGLASVWALSFSVCAQSNAPSIDLQSAPSSSRVYVDIGTQGLGLGYAHRLTESVDGRVGISSLKLSTETKGDANQNGNSFEATAALDLTNLGLYADWHVFGGGFRLTSGVQVGTNKLDVKGKVSNVNQITLNGNSYTGANNARVDGQINLGSTAPYLGIGYASRGSAESQGFSLNFDLGVRLGKADASLKASGFDGLTANQKAQFDSDLAKEQAKLQDKASILKTYPVLALGVSYRW